MIALAHANIDFIAGKPLPPLTWEYWQWGVPGRLRKTAIVCCGFGHTGTANPNIHVISADGTMSPSWVCPFECSWHEFARLEGWEE